MAGKKKEAPKAAESEAPKSAAAKSDDVKAVYRTDLGESIPPQASNLNPDRAK